MARAKTGKKAPARTPSKPAPRADFGKPVDGFIAKQPEAFRKILEELRTLILEVAPDAVGSIKWGMAHYTIDGAMYAATNAHKHHVTLIIVAPGSELADPAGRLEGEGKMGRHLKLKAGDTIPRAAVKKWLKAAAKHARS